MNGAFLSVLVGALIALQPVIGFAAKVDRNAMKKMALEVRAQVAEKHQALQKKRNTRAMQGKACSSCATDGCCGCFVIRPCDFGLDQDTTYVISEPGKYTLQQDVVFYPADEFTPAILILSDNVTLDLCEHTLSQGNDTPNAYGVQIGEGYFYEDPDHVLKNVEVENGNIVDFTAIGLFCYNGSFDEPSAEAAFEDLRFHDLNILDCGSSPSGDFASGIDLDSFADFFLFDPAVNVAYKNVRIENCNVNGSLGNGAINVYTGDDVIVANTQANDTLSIRSTLFGGDFGPAAWNLVCRNLQMFDCQGNGTQDVDAEATEAVCIGAYMPFCSNVYLKNCQFNDTFGESDRAVRCAEFDSTQNGIYENCQFNNARGGDLAVQINGVHMSDAPFQVTEGNGLKFINCQFNGLRISENAPAADETAGLTGFLGLTVRNVVFERCQACNIITENPGFNAFGIRVFTFPQDPTFPHANTGNITFTDCVASDITGGKRAMGLVASSINVSARSGDQASLSNIVFENCISERIRGLSSTERVAGIANSLEPRIEDASLFPNIFNLYVRDCRVSDVHAGSGNPLSAGILVESVANPVLENNSVSDCDVGILFTGTDDIIPNAFQLAASYADAKANPPVPIDIEAPVGLSSFESFENKTRHETVQVLVPDDVDAQHEFLFPTNADLTSQDWESGDKVVYKADGGLLIPGLINGHTYYAIVYSPGFTKRGLVQNNNVTNCLVAGYKDDRCPTKSAWINNVALLNGSHKPSHHANFAIKWPNKPQVDKGTLGEYPKHPNKNFNTSLIYAKKKGKHHHSHSDR